MKEAKFYMKKIIRYQCRSDLKWIRQINQLPKEFVAAYIGYSTRTLERIEAENAVADEGTAKRLCCIYDMNFIEDFYEIDKRHDDWIKEQMANHGCKPKNVLLNNSKYYCLYVRKTNIYRDCVVGKGLWIRDYNRTKEVRRLRQVNAKAVVERTPYITIINDENEWTYWYFKLCVGKIYKVLVSEACMKTCLRECLEERVVDKNELMRFDGTTDIMFWGTSKGKLKSNGK